MRLNLGCGSQVLAGWINVDYSLGARLSKLPLFGLVNRWLRLFNLQWDQRIVLHDLCKPLPWADESVAEIYSSHTLEHLSRSDGRRLLTECRRVLRPGGVLRILVPDLRHVVDSYLAGRIAADEFVEQLGVVYESGGGRLKRRLAPFFQYPHKCMYDEPKLVAILTELGFAAGGRQAFDSAIADIREIELADRTQFAVVVEGRRN
jgi:SAM-dependent methyltransferase